MVTQACITSPDARRYSRAPPTYFNSWPDRRNPQLFSSTSPLFHHQSQLAANPHYHHDLRAAAILVGHAMPDGSFEQDLTSPPRKRIAVACGRCRKRKIRCSGDPGNGQSCNNCKNAGAEPCLFLRVASTEAPIRSDFNAYQPGYSLDSPGSAATGSRTTYPLSGGRPGVTSPLSPYGGEMASPATLGSTPASGSDMLASYRPAHSTGPGTAGDYYASAKPATSGYYGGWAAPGSSGGTIYGEESASSAPGVEYCASPPHAVIGYDPTASSSVHMVPFSSAPGHRWPTTGGEAGSAANYAGYSTAASATSLVQRPTSTSPVDGATAPNSPYANFRNLSSLANSLPSTTTPGEHRASLPSASAAGAPGASPVLHRTPLPSAPGSYRPGVDGTATSVSRSGSADVNGYGTPATYDSYHSQQQQHHANQQGQYHRSSDASSAYSASTSGGVYDFRTRTASTGGSGTSPSELINGHSYVPAHAASMSASSASYITHHHHRQSTTGSGARAGSVSASSDLDGNEGNNQRRGSKSGAVLRST